MCYSFCISLMPTISKNWSTPSKRWTRKWMLSSWRSKGLRTSAKNSPVSAEYFQLLYVVVQGSETEVGHDHSTSPYCMASVLSGTRVCKGYSCISSNRGSVISAEWGNSQIERREELSRGEGFEVLTPIETCNHGLYVIHRHGDVDVVLMCRYDAILVSHCCWEKTCTVSINDLRCAFSAPSMSCSSQW